MRDLPPGWSRSSISDLISADGVFADGDWVETKDQNPDGEVRLVQLADVGDGAFLDRSSRFLTATRAVELRCTTLKEGDILIARMPNPLGRACIFPGSARECVTVVDVCIVRPARVGPDPQWLMYAINAPQMRLAIAALQSGSTRQRISRNNLAGIAIPVPPIPEQRRIVAEIEKQFTRLDYAVSALKAVMERVQAYSQATLNSQTRPASQGCAGWARRSLNDLSDIGTGVTPLRSNDDFWRAGTIPWVTSTAVNRPFVDEPQDLVTEVALKRTNLKVYSPGTLLIAMYGEGKTRGKVSELRISATINQALAAVQIRPQWGEYREYIKLALTSAYDQIRRQASGGVQPNLNLGMIGAIEAWLPPPSEVARITSDLSAQVTDAEHMQSGVAVALVRASRLRQAILKKAFEGKLVPQDPTDEPASVLIERIRSTRAHPPTSRYRS